MQCDICTKKKATVHLTEIVDEQMSEMHLCEECARQKSAQMEQQFGLSDLLAGLTEIGKPVSAAKDAQKNELKCAGCGLIYEDFRKFGRLGCGECYVSFKEHLAGLLKKIHGSNKHLGKAPDGHEPAPLPVIAEEQSLVAVESFNIDDLKQQLQAAIKLEDFEKAALLRDKIRSLENK